MAPRTAASVTTRHPVVMPGRNRRKRILGSPQPNHGAIAQALEGLATIAQAAELTYRAAERKLRDRGVAAQLWACAEQAHELHRTMRARAERLGAMRGRAPTFPRFSEHVSDDRVLRALLTVELGVRRTCAHLQSAAVDDATLLRELHTAACASAHREAWLETLLAAE